MFATLKEYREDHGDCLVPRQYKEDRQLGQWVAQQRQRHSHSKLDPARRKSLEAIGFVW